MSCFRLLDELRAGASREEAPWPELANDIRRVDGNHDLGAGELAARLTELGWSRASRVVMYGTVDGSGHFTPTDPGSRAIWERLDATRAATPAASEPITRAGKQLLAFLMSYDEDDHPHASGEAKRRLAEDIAAIEAEALALSREPAPPGPPWSNPEDAERWWHRGEPVSPAAPPSLDAPALRAALERIVDADYEWLAADNPAQEDRTRGAVVEAIIAARAALSREPAPPYDGTTPETTETGHSGAGEPVSPVAPALRIDLDTLDKWQEAAEQISVEAVAFFGREHSKSLTEKALRDLGHRASDLAMSLWNAGHRNVDGRWDPPSRYMRDNAKARADTPDADVEALADLFMDLRLDGPAADGWTYQDTARHYARIILGRWLAGIRQDSADPAALPREPRMDGGT